MYTCVHIHILRENCNLDNNAGNSNFRISEFDYSLRILKLG